MRILIADDEPNLLLTLADILLDEGHDVLTAPDGETAFDLLEKHSIDVLITDMRMPGTSGLDLLHAVTDAGYPTRVILMSAYAVDDAKRSALREGALAVMDKPLDIDVLLDLVRERRKAAVLVLSDDPGLAPLSAKLKEQGYQVTTSATTRHAVELSQQIRFQVLLIDCALEESSGLEAYLALRPVANEADAIMLTGDAEQRATAHAAIRETAFASLDKPTADAELPALLTRLLGQRATGERAKPPFPGGASQ